MNIKGLSVWHFKVIATTNNLKEALKSIEIKCNDIEADLIGLIPDSDYEFDGVHYYIYMMRVTSFERPCVLTWKQREGA